MQAPSIIAIIVVVPWNVNLRYHCSLKIVTDMYQYVSVTIFNEQW